MDKYRPLILTFALCILLLVSNGNAESMRASLFSNEIDEFIISTASVIDTLYMLGTEDLYEYSMKNMHLSLILPSDHFIGQALMTEGGTLFQQSYAPNLLIGGDDTLYAIDTSTGIVSYWDGSQFVFSSQLDWSGITENNEGWEETRDIKYPQFTNGYLCMLVANDFDDRNGYSLHIYDVSTGSGAVSQLSGIVEISKHSPGKILALRSDKNEWVSTVEVIDLNTNERPAKPANRCQGEKRKISQTVLMHSKAGCHKHGCAA